MTNIDDRVVNLKFDNKQFESATAASMSTLDRLKKSLDFSSSKKSMTDLQNVSKGFNLGNIGTSIEGIDGKFLAMATVGVTALSQITSAALAAGTSLVKSLTIDPVSMGFKDYELQINAVQTIMANTGLSGAKGLKVVESTLSDLNEYANLTIYDFSQMTQNIGRFTAAGVAIKPATDAIKGMSNVAALTGANTEQLGSAMYQMSQALSTGVIRLMDWNSLANANMGTKNMQMVLEATAKTMKDNGKLMDASIKKSGNFRDSLQSGWLTTDIFTKSMSIMAGTVDEATGKYRAFTIAELKGKGYTLEQAKALNKLSQAAIESAVNIRTYSQMTEALKEGVATAWGAIFKTLFGNIFQATTLFTSMYNVLYDFFTKPIYELNDFLKGFVKLGGMKQVIGAVGAAFGALSVVFKALKDAWTNVFPPQSSQGLVDLITNIKNFFKAITLGQKGFVNLRQTFTGFFQILNIGKMVVSGVFGFIKDLFGLFSSGGSAAAGGLLALGAGWGTMMSGIANFLKNSQAIPKFFDMLIVKLTPVVEFLKGVATSIGTALSSLPDIFGKVASSATTADNGLTPLQKTMAFLSNVWDKFTTALKNSIPFFQSVGNAIKNAFTGVGDGAGSIFQKIADAFNNINWTTIFKVAVGGGLLAMMASVVRIIWSAITLLISQPIKVIKSVRTSFMLINENLNQFKNVLTSYQNSIKYKSLLMIAASILMLAVAVKVISTIDPKALGLGMGAITVMFAELIVVMKQLSSVNKDILKASASMILIAIALDLLSVAILAYGNMDPVTLLKGGIMVGVLLRMLQVMITDMGKMNGDMLKTGAGIMFIAVAMNLFATAILMFGQMDPKTLLKGGLTIVALVIGISAAMNMMPKEGQMVKASAGIMLIAIAMNLMIIPMKVFAGMDTESLYKSMNVMGSILLAMVVALNLLKGPGVLAGAAGLLIASAAFMVFAGVLAVLNAIGLGSVITAVIGLAVAMGVIGVVATALSETIPFIYAFGVALAILGGGFALIGLGALAFAAAMSIVVGLMTLGIPVLADAINNFIDLLPLIGKAFYESLVMLAQAFILASPAIFEAIEVFITGILTTIDNLIPEGEKTLNLVIDAFIRFITKRIPDLATAGANMILGILNGLGEDDKIRKITSAAGKLVVQFINGIADQLPDIIKAGTNLIIKFIVGIGAAALDIAKAAGDTMLKFLNGITDYINTHSGDFNKAGSDLVQAIIDGVVGGFASLATAPLKAVGGFFGGLIAKAREVLDSHSPSKVFIKIGQDVVKGFVIGVVAGRQDIIDSVNSINEAVKQAQIDAVNNIKSLKDKLKRLEAVKKKSKVDLANIAQTKRDLAQAESEQKKLAAAYATVNKEHKTQIQYLEILGGRYEKLAAKLDAAKQAYADAVKTRDDYAASIKDKYSALPALDATTSVDDYFKAIKEATANNIKFKKTLDALRKLGLDDNQYKDFMEQGTAIQPFLDELLKKGGGAVTELNKIDGSLTDSATSLGKSASDALYQAGVKAAKGIVDGLQTQMNDLTKLMKKIGKILADELKKELGIHSPSKVFQEIGEYTAKGLAMGMENNSNVINMSARRMGQIAIESLRDSMSGIADVMGSDIDMTPVIAPVLDLDQFRKDATGINDILAPSTVAPVTSVVNARSISAAADAQAQQTAQDSLAATGTTVEFTQINNSPKALSTADIYRQTKNQLSIVKGALKP